MRTVLLASLRTHGRRYVAALLAVTVAVGFVVVTNALASAAKDGLSAGVEDAYPGADLVVRDEFEVAPDDVAATLAAADQAGDRATVIASTWTRVAADGTSWGDTVSVSTVADDPELRRQEIVSGDAPTAPDEALLKASTAESNGVGIGDRLTVGTGQQSQEVRIVGLSAASTYLDADVHVPWPTVDALGGFPQAVAYGMADGGADAGDDSGAVRARADELAGLVAAEVQARDDYVADQVAQANQGVDVVSYLLLLFAGIAGFVSVLVIANTFTILFAQRTRELALLRCVGATRARVLRSVRRESLVLAVVAATVGVVGGVATGYAIAAVVRAFAGDRVGAVDFSPVWLVAAFLGGVLTTLAAAWWPTRAVTRVSPLAALRSPEDSGPRGRSGRLRVAAGTGALITGSALLALAVVAESLPVLMLGGMTSFVGVLMLGPVIVPAALRLVGSLAGRSGPAARIAAANAVRHPRRSAATTSSLLVGVTLATAVLTGMAGARGAVDTEMAASYPVDIALTGDGAIDDSTVREVADVDGVADAAGVPGVVAQVGPLEGVALLAPSTGARELGRDADALTPRDGTVLIPSEVSAAAEEGVPDEVTVTVDGRSTTLRTQLVPAQWGEAAVVSTDTLAELGAEGGNLAIWVRAADDVDADALRGDLGAVSRDSGLESTSSLQDRAWVDTQLDVVVWAVLGLLSVGILIALVGIANTVGLSVLERGREHALLRALGLTRRQLRRVLAAEGLLLALVAALLGTALGVTYGWLGVLTVVTPSLPGAGLQLPLLQLGGVVVAAAAAGLLACVLPARRAARVVPAEGLTLD